MLKAILTGVFCLPSLAPAIALAAERSPCPASAQPVTLAVRPFDSPLEYSFTYSESAMTQIFVTGGKSVASNAHLHGLTGAQYKASFDLQYYWQKFGAGWCLAPVKVVAHVGFTGMKIYVDSKYGSGTCQRRAVLIHEAKHVAINYQEMNAGIPLMEADLRRGLAQANFPVYVADLEAGKKYIGDYFNYFVVQGFNRIDNNIRQRNAALDSTQEYAAIGALCPNW